MKQAIEQLWNEYFSEKCAAKITKEERLLLRSAEKLRKQACEQMTKEQTDAIEKYIEIIYEIQETLTKKAFIKGCEFSISFLFQAGNFL